MFRSRSTLTRWTAPLAIAGLFSAVDPLLAQPDKSAKTGASTVEPAAPAAPEQFGAKNLLRDDVPDAEAPQYNVVNDAIAKFLARDIEGARKLFKDAKTTFPKLPPEGVLTAKMLIVAKQGAAARAELEQSVRSNPTDPEAFLIFAESAISDRRITDAEALLDRVGKLLEAYKDNPYRKNNLQKRYLNAMALVAEARSQWEEAKKYLDGLIALDTDKKNANAHARLGRVLFQLSNPSDPKDPKLKAAWDECNIAAGIDKGVPSPNVALGIFYEQNKDRANAKRFFDLAIAEKPTDATKDRVLRSHLTVTEWAIGANELAYADKVSAAALGLDPNSIEANLQAAILARFNKRYADAEKRLDSLHLRNPSNFAISNQLALVLAEQNEADKRKRGVEMAKINYNANNQEGTQPQILVEALTTLAVALYKNGNVNEASQILQQVMNNNALNSDSAYYVAKIASDNGKLAEAVQMLKAALQQPVFFMKQDAQKLHDELVKKLEAAPASGSTTTKTPPPGK